MIILLVILAAILLGGLCYFFLNTKKLDIKDDKVGHGQYGHAHWLTEEGQRKVYQHVSPGKENTPGLLVGGGADGWLLDASDHSALLLAPPGAGKSTALYIPTIVYNGRVNINTGGNGASLIIMDVKGDLYRKCAAELQKDGYRTPVLDLRSIFKSYHYNIMYRVNREIDAWKAANSKKEKAMHYGIAERYAKVIATAIIGTAERASGENGDYFNETSKGLITGLILLVAQYGDPEERHIISVFNLIIDLSGAEESTAKVFGQQRSKLAAMLEGVTDRRIRGYVGTTTSADARTTLNIISSALSKLLKFIDAELEQAICSHDSDLDALEFIQNPTAIFLIVPDENETRNFLPSLFIRFLTDDLINMAEVDYAGTLPRPFFYLFDEFGNYTIPGVTSFFTAIRSRGGRVMAAIQSDAQLFLKYRKEEATSIKDGCQIKINTYVSPSANDTAKAISDMLGKETIMTGSKSVHDGKVTTSTQMMGRPLMTIDELVTLPQYTWIIQKSGTVPMKSIMPGYWTYLHLESQLQITQPEYDYKETHVMTIKHLSAAVNGQYTPLTPGMFDDDEAEEGCFE